MPNDVIDLVAARALTSTADAATTTQPGAYTGAKHPETRWTRRHQVDQPSDRTAGQSTWLDSTTRAGGGLLIRRFWVRVPGIQTKALVTAVTGAF